MLQRIGRKRILVAVASLFFLAALWSYAWHISHRLNPQEQFLVGSWSDVGPPQRIVHFNANRTFSNTVLPDGRGSFTGRWFIDQGFLHVRQDSDSLFGSGLEKQFPIYSHTTATLQLGDKQSVMASYTRLPP